MTRLFRDEILLHVAGGRGGDGCVSFARERLRPRGGPDGGPGGDGGDVVIVADDSLNTLDEWAGRGLIRAQDGARGGPNSRQGRKGRALFLKVPVGTVIRDARQNRQICDLDRRGQEFFAARGGKGGRGNRSFATPTVQSPREAEKGSPGQERRYRLELKMIADVGIVGLPNAGKSTLLSKLSRARPKIAAYPFTTLTPSLGVVELDAGHWITVADLPGLIEGAHRGVGLGDRFLRHVERTRLILHLVDVSADAATPPEEAYRVTRRELNEYSASLAARPELVVASKIDLAGSRAGAKKLAAACGAEVMEVAAAEGRGLKRLKEVLREIWGRPAAVLS
jgi:GTP-binding protein